MEKIKYFKVEAPKGYEIDKENSTWDNICFKKIEQEVRTWEDLIGRTKTNGCKYIHPFGWTANSTGIFSKFDKNIFVDDKHAKSALAMAQISQLIPYYGNKITDEEWDDEDAIKYIIERISNRINTCYSLQIYHLLAFHTAEQRDNFLKYNEQLVKDYLMID